MAVYMIIPNTASGVVYPSSIIRGTSPTNALNNFTANGKGAYLAEDYSAFNTGWTDGRFPVPYPGDNMHWEWDTDTQQPVAVANPPEIIPDDPTRAKLVLRRNNQDITRRTTIEIASDGVTTLDIDVQKRETLDDTDKIAADPPETILIRPNQLVTLSDSSVTLDNSGLATFTIGPETKKGTVEFSVFDSDGHFVPVTLSMRFV